MASKKENINDCDVNITMEHFYKALSDITPAYGNNNNKYSELLPLDYKPLFKHYYDEITHLMSNMYRLKTIMCYGKSGTGKSTFGIYLASKHKTKYVKLVRAIEFITYDEYGKVNYISDILHDAFASEESLIIIDDIHILMNYAEIGNVIGYSNRIFQTILTLLKSQPENKLNKLTIVIICSNENLRESLESNFNHVYEFDKLNKNDAELLSNNKYSDDTRFTVRELLNTLENDK